MRASRPRLVLRLMKFRSLSAEKPSRWLVRWRREALRSDETPAATRSDDGPPHQERLYEISQAPAFIDTLSLWSLDRWASQACAGHAEHVHGFTSDSRRRAAGNSDGQSAERPHRLDDYDHGDKRLLPLSQRQQRW